MSCSPPILILPLWRNPKEGTETATHQGPYWSAFEGLARVKEKGVEAGRLPRLAVALFRGHTCPPPLSSLPDRRKIRARGRRQAPEAADRKLRKPVLAPDRSPGCPKRAIRLIAHIKPANRPSAEPSPAWENAHRKHERKGSRRHRSPKEAVRNRCTHKDLPLVQRKFSAAPFRGRQL